MPIFEDMKGERWSVELSVGAIRKVRAQTGVNLHEALDVEARLFQRLMADPELLVDVLWPLVEDQATAKDVDAGQFAFRLGGDALDNATTALLDSLVGFTSSPGERKLLARALEKTAEIQERGRDLIAKRLDSVATEKAIAEALERLDREAEQALQEKLAQASRLRSSSGGVPDGRESIPIPSPSEPCSKWPPPDGTTPQASDRPSSMPEPPQKRPSSPSIASTPSEADPVETPSQAPNPTVT